MRFLVIALAFCVWTTPSFARAPMQYSLKMPGPHEDLKDHNLYEVKFTCAPSAAISPDGDKLKDWVDGTIDAFIHHNESANHYIIIGNDPATPDPSDQGKVKLPDKAISIMPIFSIKDRSMVNNFGVCPKSIYVQATQRVYFIPTVAWSSSYTEGAALAGLYEATKLISPIWSIFNPAAIPAAIATKISNAQATEDPIKNILGKLNLDQNYGEAQRLRTGTFVITTKYSTVTLQVTKISSIIKAGPDELRQDFRAQLDAAPQKLTATGFEDTCNQIAANLLWSGFSKDEDIPYALTYLARVPLATKLDIIHCLGLDYAVRAARLGDILWAWIPDSKRVTEDEAATVYGGPGGPRLQPDYKRIEGLLDDFVTNVSRVTKNLDANGKVMPQYVAALKSDMTPTVLINDKTVASAFFGLPPLDAQTLGEKFMANGYYRFGCYAQITDKFGNNTDGAAAMLVSFKVGKDAPSPVSLDTAVGIRVFFGKEGLVSQLTIIDKRAVISAALEANGWNCNGFAVQKPPTS